MANDTATVTQTVNTISVDELSQNTLTISSNAGGSLTVSDSTPSTTSVTVSPVSSTLNLESNFSPKESPIFSGSPTAPTPPSGDNSTRLATTAFVNSSVSLENTLSEMNDVNITSLADTELLQYDNSTSKWINKTLAEAGVASASALSTHSTSTSNPHNVTASQIGLGNVTDESKASMFNDSVFTGNPTAVTQTAGNDSTRLATTKFVGTAISNLIGGAGPALDTLVEIQTALGSNPTLAATLTSSIGTKAPLANPALTGTPTAPTASASTNTTQLATTQYVTTAVSSKAPLASPTFTGTPEAPTAISSTNNNQIANTTFVNTVLIPKANIASPALTGTPTAPTASSSTNTTQIATTAFVQSAVNAGVDTKDTLAELDDVNINNASLATLQVIRYNGDNSKWENQPLNNPVITLAGDVVGSGTLNNLANLTINTAIQPNSVDLATDTVGNYVATISRASGSPISVTGSGNENASIQLDISDATTSAKGIASFDSDDFTVSSGAVSLKETYLTAHPAISGAADSSSNSGRTYIQDITLDSFGHITDISTGTESVTVPSWVPSVNPNYLTAHPAISGAADSSSNSGRTYIQDITLDSFGHITDISTGTESVTVPSWVPSVNPNYLTAHPAISGAADSSSNSGRTYIQDITLDSFGHITNISTGTESVTVPSWVPSTDPNYLTSIASGSIGSLELATNAVTADEIAANAVATSELATDAVETLKIKDLNVTTAKLADDAITTAKILDDAITTAKILDANVTTAKILDANVTTAKIANQAVDTNKLAADSVGYSQLKTSAVAAINISTNAVTTPKIANDAVTSAKLAHDITIQNDLTVLGNLSISGNTTIVHDNVNTTERLSITNDGTGPAILANQEGSQPVVDFQDDGTSVFYIKDGGNVGLGTTDPSVNLDIEGANNVIADLVSTTANANTTIRFRDKSSTEANKATIGYDGTANGLVITTGGFTAGNGIFINDSQDVGIGIDNVQTQPLAKLDVHGNLRIDDVQTSSSDEVLVYNTTTKIVERKVLTDTSVISNFTAIKIPSFTGSSGTGDHRQTYGSGNETTCLHDGANNETRVETTANNAYTISADTLKLKRITGIGTAQEQVYASFTSGGAAQLFHAGAAKIATSATGATVTGTLTAGNLSAANITATDDLTVNSALTVGGILELPDGSVSAPALAFTSETNTGIYATSSQLNFAVDGSTRLYVGSAGIISAASVYSGTTGHFRNVAGTWKATTGGANKGWEFLNTAGSPSNSIPSATLSSTGTLVLNGKTTATKIELYETYTDPSNYERSFFKHDSSFLEIGTEALGTGTASGIKVRTTGVTALSIAAGGLVTVESRTSASSTNILSVGGSNNGYMSVRHVEGKNSSSNAYGPIYINHLSNNNVFLASGGGGVGIGTTSSLSSKLQIDAYTVGSNGNQSVSGTASIFTNSGSDGLYLGVKNASYPNRGYAFKVTNNGVNSDFTIREHGSTGDRFTIQTGGNVGIGVTDPDHKLHVNGTIAIKGGELADTARIHFQASDESNRFTLESDFNSTSTTDLLGFRSTTADNILVLKGDGNVGINCTPSRLLEISDSTQATGAILRLSNTASGSTWTTGDTIGTLEFYTSDASAAGNKALLEAVQLTGSSDLTYPSLVGLDFYASTNNVTDLAMRVSPSTLRIHSAEDKSWTVGDKVASLEFFSADNSGNSANSVRASIDCVAQSTFGSSNGLSFATKGDSAGDPVERMRIDSIGNVGIGTTSPAAKLEVNGGTGVASSGGTIVVRQKGNTSNDGISITSSHANSHRIWKDSSSTLYIGSTVDPDAFAQTLAGKIGINDTAPQGKLQIDAGGDENCIHLVNSGQSSSNFATRPISIIFGDEQKGASARHQASINCIREAWSSTPAALTFKTATGVNTATERMRITSDGKVGIGTTSPSSLLNLSDASNNLSHQIGFSYVSGGTETDAFTIGRSSSTGNLEFHSDINNHGFEFKHNAAGTQEFNVINMDVGIGTTAPAEKLDVKGTAKIGGNSTTNCHLIGSKGYSLTASFTTGLTVSLANHTACHVKVFISGDWTNHSSVAYVGEFLIQNTGNVGSYNEPGIILTEYDNLTSDRVAAKIVDGTSDDFEIQFQAVSSSSTGLPVSAKITYHVMGDASAVS